MSYVVTGSARHPLWLVGSCPPQSTKVLISIPSAKYSVCMARKKPQKPMTVAEAGRRGGKARAAKHSKEQLREWAKLGGWPKGRPRKSKAGGKKE